MTTKEFIEKSKPLIPWWKLYQKRLKENPMNRLDPLSAYICRILYPVAAYLKIVPKSLLSLPGWCPPVLLIRALRWELIFEKYLREVK